MTTRLTGSSATRRVDFDGIRGYKPIIGGLRHLTRLPTKPPGGTLIKLLDDDLYRVAKREQPRHVYDCHVCAEVYLAEQQAEQRPGEDEQPLRMPAPRRSAGAPPRDEVAPWARS